MTSHILSHPDKALTDHIWGVTNIALDSIAESYKSHTDVIATATKLHDIGKMNGYFQTYIRETNPAEKARMHETVPETYHAKLSAIVAMHNWLARHPGSWKHAISLYMAIEKHHGNLKKPEFHVTSKDVEIMLKQMASISELDMHNVGVNIGIELNHKDIVQFITNAILFTTRLRRNLLDIIEEDVTFYMDTNYIYSSLINADKLDAGVGETYVPDRMDWDMPFIVDDYKRENGWNKSTVPINILRNEAFDEATVMADMLYCAGVYSLNIPTGLGKTMLAMAIAVRLRHKVYLKEGYYPRIIYALPFTSIIEQNFNVLRDMGISEDARVMLKHHHLSEISYKTEEDELIFDTGEASLLIEAWQSEIVITTFVQLFHALISNKNRMLKKSNKIPGSIIILDEIQAVPLRFWRLINKILKHLVKYHNTYVIMVTASKPTMIDIDADLVKDPGHYFEKMSRTRMSYDSASITIDDLVVRINNELDNQNTVLAVLNTKQCVKDCYSKLTEHKRPDVDYVFLTTDIVPAHRLDRIKTIKDSKKLKVVIATQMVEAGVDIDLDVVFRDIAPFDSIMQSAGRCNRNFLRECGMVYIINLEDGKYAHKVYDPILLSASIQILMSNREFKESQFLTLSEQYFDNLKRRMVQNSEFLKSIYRLNYNDGSNAIDKFKLIDDDDKSEVFIEVDKDAIKVFKQFRQLGFIQDRNLRKEAFLKIKNVFSRYVIPINNKRLEKNPPEKIGELGWVRYDDRHMYYDEVTGYI